MQTNMVNLALQRYIAARKQQDKAFLTANLSLMDNGLWILTDKYTDQDYRHMNTLEELIFYMVSTLTS